MATYIIGDVQGFREKFVKLLSHINFDSDIDRLFLAGDLVNRGPDSLGTLKKIMSLGTSVSSVLGNHDVFLLALYYAPDLFDKPKHNMDDILNSPDLKKIISYLEKTPLAIYDNAENFFLSHAGLYPMWSIEKALALSKQWTSKFNGAKNKNQFLADMFHNHPTNWNECNSKIEILRFTLNAFTRMRYLDEHGCLNFSRKGPIDPSDTEFIPWFRYQKRALVNSKLTFGHWSSLNLTKKEQEEKRIYPTDSGVVWTGRLSALRIDDMMWFHVDDH